MSKWLEEEEIISEKRKIFSIEMRKRIESKKAKILQNYQINNEVYEYFIQNLLDITERANKLLERRKEDVRVIENSRKDSPLDNKLCLFSSSKRVELKLLTGIFSGYDNFKYKHARSIYFFISKEIGKLEIEIKESYYPKGHTKKYKKGRKHLLFRYEFNNLNDNIANEIIEWLAFKIEFEKISFVKKDFFKWK